MSTEQDMDRLAKAELVREKTGVSFEDARAALEASDYDVLDASEFRHVRINHSERFAERKNHINGIENFWSQAKRVLRKYNGIERKSFTLFLKECEFRFNYGSPSQQLKTLRSWCQIGS